MGCKTLSCSLAVLAALAPSSLAGDVLVVDVAGGPGTFAFAQAAVDAAVDGDIVLIRDGGGANTLDVVGKGIAVIADGETAGFGEIRVAGTAPGQTVVLRNLRAYGDIFSDVPALVVTQCAGPVVLEDLTLTVDPAVFNDANPTLVVSGSQAVNVVRSSLIGRPGVGSSDPFIYGIQGGEGATVSSSQATFAHCTILGGDGGQSLIDTPLGTFVLNSTFGGPALHVAGATVHVTGCTIGGGDGGDGGGLGAELCDVPSSSGGDGVWVNLGGQLVLLDCDVTAGLAGGMPPGCLSSASDGEPVDVSSGSAVAVPGAAGTLVLPATAHEGDAFSLALGGAPGAETILLLSLGACGAPVGSLVGGLLPDPSFIALGVGALPGSGELELPVSLAPNLLPVGLDGFLLLGQTATLREDGPGALLSSGSVLAVLAAGL